MSLLQRGLTAIIRVYQVAISPLLGQRCRYHPTCSSFMTEAIASHGTGRGIWLGIKRLIRCHPWAEGGHDPVPQNNQAGGCASLQNAKAEQ